MKPIKFIEYLDRRDIRKHIVKQDFTKTGWFKIVNLFGSQ